MSSFKLQVYDAAELDLDESYVWYEEHVSGLGDQFIDDVRESMDYISRSPYSFEKKLYELHQCVLKRFPFAIYYKINTTNKIVWIIGVLHFKRDELVLVDRLQDSM
ncbi:MAG: type II toxin-antitoxin system RelE/ParE family toxin [Bacteroidales bacterium]|nr:type II toxin-antitoxin system RelE/ParE family toxin [Bacteroidales bacterium]